MLTKSYNYLIKIEYGGSKFVGWQYQTNGVSVQEKLEQVISRVLKEKITIIGAGRTDKGVHAFGQFANFKVNKKISKYQKFLESVNFFLRKNLISILSIKKKNLEFHSRFDAKERFYEYKIINRLAHYHLIDTKLGILNKN